MLRNSICESLRLLAHSNCGIKTSSAQAKQIPVRFVFAQTSVCALRFSSRRTKSNWQVQLRLCVCFFCRRFQTFQSLFSHCSLVSVAVWIYFNRLQNTAAMELNYFVFETFYLLPFLASVSRRPQGPFDFR